jgi:prepilin-type N-terminal cleavage/methylation domain-containing protein
MKKNGFTLIELIVVISVIALLAALAMPVFNSVTKHSIIQRAQSENQMIVTAIESYHSAYGFYPPSGTNFLVNPLYYELVGTTTTNTGSGPSSFTTLDNANTIATATISSTFGIGGFMNCTKGSGEDMKNAQNFIPGLKPGMIATNSNGVIFIVTGASSDPGYQPLPGVYSSVGLPANPWCYTYPGTNNPNSYDLWLNLTVGGKTNVICNWSSQVQVR